MTLPKLYYLPWQLLQHIFLILLLTLSLIACNTYSARQTTSILEYPSPQIINFSVDGTNVNGEIAITLNPSVNNDLRQYWLLLGSNSSPNFSDIDVARIRDINNLDAEISAAYIPFLFTTLTNVNSFFASRSVRNYAFSETITNAQRDYFYQLSARAFGTNDSYAVAYQHNGWIVSGSALPITFYLGYEVTCTFTATPRSMTTTGYTHTTNPPTDPGNCSDIITPNPEIIFFTEPETLPDNTIREDLRLTISATANSNVGILATDLTHIGEIITLNDINAQAYITNTLSGGTQVGNAAIGLLATQGRIFLVRDSTGAYFSKIEVVTFIPSSSATTPPTPATATIRILSTGPRGQGITQF